MIREEVWEDAGAHFIGKTDAQILRELFGARDRRGITRRLISLPDDQSEHQDEMGEDEAGSQTADFLVRPNEIEGSAG